MANIRLDDGLLYEQVHWHTRRKHAFISAFLNIWAENVKRNPPTLDIFDLYASTGLCYCPDAEKYGIPETKWPGSAMLSSDCLRRYPRGRTLFLNTYNIKEEETTAQVENLQQLTADLPQNIRVIIESAKIEKAVHEACNYVDPRYPNLWILDPYAASTLPWKVVETIGRLRGEYQGDDGLVIRKPEILITLMTSDLQRNVDLHPHIIDIALGMNEDEWRPILDMHVAAGMNTREAFITMYRDRLMEMFEKEPIVAEVQITEETAIVYTMFLCTDHNAGHYVMKLHAMPQVQVWEGDWRRDAQTITANKKLPPGQTKLF